MIDISEAVKKTDMFELAQKTNYKLDMTDDEKDVVAELDEAFKKIGETGHDRDHEISQFLRKVVNQEIYEAPDEVLDMLFERGSIGEFDDYDAAIMPPENTLVAYEAGYEGTVPNSYLDIDKLAPAWHNLQIQSELSYSDLRRNGWKSVSLLSEYAVAALKNTLYAQVFTTIDNAITNLMDNYLAAGSSAPTEVAMDWLSNWVAERADGSPLIIGLRKYILAASKLENASDSMKEEIYKNGLLGYYGGIPMKAISSAKKVQGQLMIPDKRIFGVAKPIGRLDMKGEIHTYQDQENATERIQLYWKDFTYGVSYTPTTLQNVAKIVLT